MSYLFENNVEDALKEFKLYQKSYPNAPHANQLIEAITNGKLELKTSE